MRRGALAVLCAWLALFAATGVVAQQATDARLGLPPLPAQTDGASNKALVELGERLFSDTKLSADGKVSCAKCHVPDLAFTDRRPHSLGHEDRPGTRNAPTLLNVAFAGPLFWDGRAKDLESQAVAPLTNSAEHAFDSPAAAVRAILQDARYRRDFERALGASGATITIELIARALSAYERTLYSGGSRFDRYLYGHDPGAMNAQAVHGLELFRHRAQCASCHTIGESSALLTDSDFHLSPLGIPADVNSRLSALTKQVMAARDSGNQREVERLIATDDQIAALGRFVVTAKPADIGKFKTPSLRNVALTAPYMHDGSVATLEQAVDLELYARGGALNYPIALTADERRDIVEFLKALTGTIGGR